jgi:hypothetical protein
MEKARAEYEGKIDQLDIQLARANKHVLSLESTVLAKEHELQRLTDIETECGASTEREAQMRL